MLTLLSGSIEDCEKKINMHVFGKFLRNICKLKHKVNLCIDTAVCEEDRKNLMKEYT